MSLRTIAAVVLVAYAVWGVPDVSSISRPVVVQVKEPTPAMKSVVKPIVKVVSKMSPLDRLWLQGIYKNAAKVVQSDGVIEPHVITTTEGLQAVHVAILRFIWRGMAENAPGEYAGLKEAIEAAITETIGDEHRVLTPELRAKAVEVFDAIAWAGLGKDE